MSLQYCKLCCAKTSNLCVTVPRNSIKKQLWIESAGVDLSEGNKICDKHFSKKSFYFTNGSKRRRLLPDAVPKPVMAEPSAHHASACGNNMYDIASQTENDIINTGIALENLQLSQQVRKLEKENAIASKKLQKMESMNDSLKVIFSESQIRRLQSGYKRVNWNANDISYGICLQAAGPRAYRHLLKKGFPLPCVSSLLKWSQSLEVEPGPLSFVIDLMEKAVDIEDDDKMCVLVFGEMNITSANEHDCSKETQKSPDYVQVVMVQGLRKSWKHPIYFDFNKPMSTTILNILITKLYTAGYHVVAMVSVMNTENYKLWSQLQISTEKPWFEHPANAEMKIFVFADVPSLTKLIRNQFIDSGLSVGGKIITMQTIKQVINHAAASDMPILWKVTEKHLNMRYSGRQEVKLAAELFSNTTANAIRRCFSLGLEVSNSCETSDFVQMVNDWFDIFNVKVSTANTIQFGQNLNAQLKVLSDMTALMSLPIVPNSTTSLPFQKGIIVSNASLDMLYGYLAKKYDIKYLVTNRISQDPLEHFFGAMRSNNGLEDRPSATQFKFRLRKYLLSKGLLFEDKP